MKHIMVDGGEALRIENGHYYILDESTGYDIMIETTRNEFIKELKRYSWLCLTTWDKQLKKDYLELVDYCKSLE